MIREQDGKERERMKWLIASDIHGSAYWCKKLMKAYEREAADRMILLGDLLYHGPRNDLPKEYAPKEVIGMLNAHAHEIYCVRGNCEAEVDQMVLDFPVLAEYMLLPVGNRLVFATHGHVFNEKNLPPLRSGDILMHGHTHVPVCVQHEAYTYLNPGSVAIPKEESWHGYMILEGTRFVWKDMGGEIKRSFELV